MSKFQDKITPSFSSPLPRESFGKDEFFLKICFNRKMKKLGFDIVLLGAPASGKETQANILKRKYAIKFVETGVHTRKLLKKKGPDGDWTRRTAGKGGALPVTLLKKFLVSEINKNQKTRISYFWEVLD